MTLFCNGCGYWLIFAKFLQLHPMLTTRKTPLWWWANQKYVSCPEKHSNRIKFFFSWTLSEPRQSSHSSDDALAIPDSCPLRAVCRNSAPYKLLVVSFWKVYRLSGLSAHSCVFWIQFYTCKFPLKISGHSEPISTLSSKESGRMTEIRLVLDQEVKT